MNTNFIRSPSLTEQAGTLRECIEMMDCYARLLSEGGFEPELREHGETAAIRFAAMRGEQSAMRAIAEFVMTALSSALQLFAGGRARPTQVRFAYSEPPYAAEYQRIFGSAARFGQEFTEMAFPRAWLDKAHRYRSPELYTCSRSKPIARSSGSSATARCACRSNGSWPSTAHSRSRWRTRRASSG
jgi:hypothetical protein